MKSFKVDVTVRVGLFAEDETAARKALEEMEYGFDYDGAEGKIVTTEIIDTEFVKVD